MLIAADRPRTEPTKDAVSRSFRACYEGLGITQDQLADLTGIPQATISRYARGASTPDLLVIAAVEDVCDDYALRQQAARRPRGWIGIQAGAVEMGTSVEYAIAVAPELTDVDRRILMDVYNGFTRPQDGAAARKNRKPSRVAE
jgi:transcriptional regulator with XRE-family HTH domain